MNTQLYSWRVAPGPHLDLDHPGGYSGQEHHMPDSPAATLFKESRSSLCYPCTVYVPASVNHYTVCRARTGSDCAWGAVVTEDVTSPPPPRHTPCFRNKSQSITEFREYKFGDPCGVCAAFSEYSRGRWAGGPRSTPFFPHGMPRSLTIAHGRCYMAPYGCAASDCMWGCH